MTILIHILFALLITACYLIGGQIEKSVRRYGVPTFAFAYAFVADKKTRAKDKMKYIWFMLMVGILSMGYGENSFLKKYLRYEWLTRAMYAFFLSIIFAIVGGNIFICFPILAVAFQVRAGKLFSIGKFDFLIEDICRALSIFVCTLLITKGV